MERDIRFVIEIIGIGVLAAVSVFAYVTRDPAGSPVMAAGWVALAAAIVALTVLAVKRWRKGKNNTR